MEKLLAEAAEQVKKGRFAKAIELYRTALGSAPDDARVRGLLAEAYKLEGNKERAFHHYKRAGLVYAASNNPEAAFHMFAEANAVGPGEADILFTLAELARQLGRPAEFESLLISLVHAANAPGDRRRLWALDELSQIHPNDVGIIDHRAEALREAGRADDAVIELKRLASFFPRGSADFTQALRRAADAALGRPDLGVEVTRTMLANGLARDALAVLVPFYQSHPDEIGVLETLLVALEALGAKEKIIPARVELIKARAKKGDRARTLADIDAVLKLAPEDLAIIEVCAHAATAVREIERASSLWKRLAQLANGRGLRLERDRAVLALLKIAPDDQQALDLGARALEEAGRAQEAKVLRQRLDEVQKQRKASASAKGPAPAKPPRPPPAATTDSVMLGEEDVLHEQSVAPRAEAPLRQPASATPSHPWSMPVGGRRPSIPPASDTDETELEPATHDALPALRSASAVPDDDPEMEATSIAPQRPRRPTTVPEEPEEHTIPPELKTVVKPKRVPSDQLFSTFSAGSVVDPFFSEASSIADEEIEQIEPDEVTSRMEALVADELRARRATDAGTQPEQRALGAPFIADLLDEA